MSESLVVMAALMGAFMAYVSWHVPLKKHFQLLGLCVLAIVFLLLVALIFKTSGKTFAQSLVDPPHWKLLMSVCVFAGVGAALAARLVTRQKK